jgi:hypothetical protein
MKNFGSSTLNELIKSEATFDFFIKKISSAELTLSSIQDKTKTVFTNFGSRFTEINKGLSLFGSNAKLVSESLISVENRSVSTGGSLMKLAESYKNLSSINNEIPKLDSLQRSFYNILLGDKTAPKWRVPDDIRKEIQKSQSPLKDGSLGQFTVDQGLEMGNELVPPKYKFMYGISKWGTKSLSIGINSDNREDMEKGIGQMGAEWSLDKFYAFMASKFGWLPKLGALGPGFLFSMATTFDGKPTEKEAEENRIRNEEYLKNKKSEEYQKFQETALAKLGVLVNPNLSFDEQVFNSLTDKNYGNIQNRYFPELIDMRNKLSPEELREYMTKLMKERLVDTTKMVFPWDLTDEQRKGLDPRNDPKNGSAPYAPPGYYPPLPGASYLPESTPNFISSAGNPSIQPLSLQIDKTKQLLAVNKDLYNLYGTLQKPALNLFNIQKSKTEASKKEFDIINQKAKTGNVQGIKQHNGDSLEVFHRSFAEAQKLSGALNNIMNTLKIGTDTFVGKVINGFDSAVSIIQSIISLAQGGGILGDIFGGLIKGAIGFLAGGPAGAAVAIGATAAGGNIRHSPGASGGLFPINKIANNSLAANFKNNYSVVERPYIADFKGEGESFRIMLKQVDLKRNRFNPNK